MKAAAVALIVVGGLLVAASVVCVFAGIWSHDDLTSRLFGTAFAAFFIGFATGGAGAMWLDVIRAGESR